MGNTRNGSFKTSKPIKLGTNTYSANAKIIRNKLKDYFSGEGAVAFQYEK